MGKTKKYSLILNWALIKVVATKSANIYGQELSLSYRKWNFISVTFLSLTSLQWSYVNVTEGKIWRDAGLSTPLYVQLKLGATHKWSNPFWTNKLYYLYLIWTKKQEEKAYISSYSSKVLIYRLVYNYINGIKSQTL